MLFVCHPKVCISSVFSFSWELKWPQEKLKTMLIQIFGVTKKEHYGMLWYFLEWSNAIYFAILVVVAIKFCYHGNVTSHFSSLLLSYKRVFLHYQ